MLLTRRRKIMKEDDDFYKLDVSCLHLLQRRMMMLIISMFSDYICPYSGWLNADDKDEEEENNFHVSCLYLARSPQRPSICWIDEVSGERRLGGVRESHWSKCAYILCSPTLICFVTEMFASFDFVTKRIRL